MKLKKDMTRILLKIVMWGIPMAVVCAQDRAPGRPGSQRMRSWGPEQATGEPDTHQAGDIPTAWASRTPDGQDEWLLLTYKEAVRPAHVRIHETYNPGAVVRVAVLTEGGREVIAWEGTDPVRPRSGLGVAKIPLDVDVKTNRVKIYLDSTGVRGWNEIDAVELVGKKGSRQWAIAATASSTFAEQSQHTFAATPAPTDEFKDFVQRSMTIYLDDSKRLEGVLLSSGSRFLVLQRRKNRTVFLVNKAKVVLAEVHGQASDRQH